MTPSPAEQSGHKTTATPIGVKRLRPISGDVRRSIKVNRDLLYEPDDHLKRGAEFRPMRGWRERDMGRATGVTRLCSALAGVPVGM